MGIGKGKLNYIWYAFAIVVFITVVILDIIDSIKTIKEFPQLNIDRDNLFGVNEVNLKDFELEEDGSLYAQSGDPWVYYTLPETTVVKIVEIAVDSVSTQNASATLHFVLEDGTWEYQYFYIHNGVNKVQFNSGEDLSGVSAIRFDFVNGKDISVKVDNVKINSHYATTLKYHIRSLIITLSIVMFAILPRANKELRNFIKAYLSFLLFIICAATDLGSLSYFFKILSIGMFCLFLLERNDRFTVKFEKMVLLLFGTLFCILMLMHGRLSGEYEILNVLCSCTFVIVAIAYLVQNTFRINIKDWIIRNRGIIFLIVCFVLLSVEVINSWLMWDAWQYYAMGSGCIREITKIFNADFSGVYNMYLAGHASLGYSLWVVLFQLFKEGTASVQIADIILAVISIYAYYQVLRKVLGEKISDGSLVLATIPYAFSPFVLGIMGNVNLDSATMYFAIIFIACSLYHFECMELIFAFLFCFTKETAVIYYVTYIIAKVISEYLSEHRFCLDGLIKFGFGTIKNYLYAMPAILWLALYKMNINSWKGSNNDGKSWNYFGIDQEVIVTKLKQVFLLNFNWIFWITIVLGVIVLYVKRVNIEKETRKVIIPISAMGIAAIGFGCVYVTYDLARYIVPIIPIVYLVTAWVIGRFEGKFFRTWNVLASVLLLAQCFRMIDPMTANMFQSILVGNKQEMYLVGNEKRFDDHIVYNRQNIYWSEALIEVLENSGYDGNMLVVFPNSYFSQYNMLGNWKCSWNINKGKLEYYDENAIFSKESKEVITCSDSADVYEKLEAMSSNRILYVVPEWGSIDTDFVANKKVVKQGEVAHKGYNVQYMVMGIE